MKIIPIIFLVVFFISVIGIILFPSVSMVFCQKKTDMCREAIHQLEKAATFFIAIFSAIIYYIAVLLIFFCISFYKDKKINLYIKRKIISFNNIFFDYLKIILSKGMLEPEVY